MAEDLLADTWLAAAKHLPDFEGSEDEVRAWLFAVARTRVADHYRKRNRRPAAVALDGHDDRATTQTTEETALSAMSAQEALARLVRHLPPDQADVVALRVLADLSVDQVAHILGRTAGSVRVLQHRALRRLEATFCERVVTL